MYCNANGIPVKDLEALCRLGEKEVIIKNGRVVYVKEAKDDDKHYNEQ